MEVKEPSTKYLARPGYKQTEVGVIPEDWNALQLCELGKFKNGINKNSEAFGHGSPFVNLMDVFGITRITSSASLGLVDTNWAEQQTYDLRKGDVIFIRSSVKPSGVGLTAVVDEDLPATVFSGFLIRFRDGGVLSNGFKRHCFYEDRFRRHVIGASSVSANTNINQDSLKRLIIAVPSTEAEQEAIAEALSDADALIESLEQLLAKKRQIKQGAMQKLLTGRKRLPGFSGGWEVKQIGEFTDCTAGGTPSTTVSQYWGGQIRWMSSGELNLKMVAEVEGRITEDGLHNSSTKIIPENCVLIGLAGQGKTRGTVAMNLVPLCTNQSIAAIFPGAAFSSRYLYYNLDARYEELRELSAGDGGRGGLNLTIIRKVSVPFPSFQEQTAIATILFDMDAEIAALEDKIAKARSLKQGMMQELLTGRIRLVRPASNVVQLPVKRESAPAPTKSHNWQINEAVVISVLAKNFGSEQWPLGRKRYTKLSYLLHRYVERHADGYLKKAAGPYNPAIKYKGPEGIALKNRYVRFHSRDKFSGFVAAGKIGEAESYFSKWYGDDVLAWLEQFRRKSNDELELLTTVDMAMEDLRRLGKEVTLVAVKQVIQGHPEWEAKLDRTVFSDANIKLAIEACFQLFADKGSDG